MCKGSIELLLQNLHPTRAAPSTRNARETAQTMRVLIPTNRDRGWQSGNICQHICHSVYGHSKYSHDCT